MKIVDFFSAMSGMNDATKGIFRVGTGLAPAHTTSGITNAAAKRRRIYNPTESISDLLVIIIVIVGCFSLLKSCTVTGTLYEKPEQPGNIVCKRLSDGTSDYIFKVGDSVLFSVVPVKGAVSYEWSIDGATAWAVNEKSNSFETKIPNQIGKYTISVFAVNQHGSSEPSSIVIEAIEAIQGGVSQDVLNLILNSFEYQEQQEFPLSFNIVSSRNWTELSKDPNNNYPVDDVDCFDFSTDWNCVTKRFYASRNSNDFLMLNPILSVTWPGCLLQGESLLTGFPSIIPITKRQQGSIMGTSKNPFQRCTAFLSSFFFEN